MRTLFRFCFVFAIYFHSCLPCLGVVSNIFPVQLISDEMDSVGKLLCYSIRENIRKSTNLALEESKSRFIVKFRSLDPDKNTEYKGALTAYSYLILFRDEESQSTLYLYDNIGICGVNMVDTVAKRIVSILDGVIEECNSMYRKREP